MTAFKVSTKQFLLPKISDESADLNILVKNIYTNKKTQCGTKIMYLSKIINGKCKNISWLKF